jgi:plastocyanin
MTNETLFYVFGIGLAVSAVVISLVALKAKNFPGKAFPLIIVWFVIFVGGATTFSVLHAQDEEHHKAAEFEEANAEFEGEAEDEAAADPSQAEQDDDAAAEGEAPPQGEAAPKMEAEPEGAAAAPTKEATAGGPGGTLQLAADPAAIAYDEQSLTSKAGNVTIDFTNPAPLEHDVAIEADGKELAGSEIITESETSVSTELEPGTYTFFCTVPGHREAGMEGTLTVK